MYKFFMLLIVSVSIFFSCTDNQDVINDFYQKAREHADSYRFDSSIYYLTLAEDYYLRNNDEERLMEVYVGFGKVYSEIGYLKESKNYDLQALELSNKLKKQKWEMHILNNLGSKERQLGNFESASKNLMNSLYFAENVFNDSSMMISNYINIGNLYKDDDKINQAKENYEMALSIIENLEKYNDLAIVYNNLGVCYEALEEVDSAKKYYKMAIKQSMLDKDTLQMVYSLKNSMDLKENQIDTTFLNEILSINKSPLISGTIYEAFYEFYKNSNKVKAYEYLKKALNSHKESGANEDYKVALSILVDLSFELKEFNQAKLFSKLMEVEMLKSVDAINSVNKVNYELADKQHKIEIMKKNMEIQRKELEKARLFKIAAAVFVAISIFLGFTIKYLRTALSEKRNLLTKLSYHLRKG